MKLSEKEPGALHLLYYDRKYVDDDIVGGNVFFGRFRAKITKNSTFWP